MTNETGGIVGGVEGPLASVGDGGRDAGGRFVAGNRAARGNPHARRVALLRSALLREVGTDDLRAVMRAMVDAAKGGDVQAAGLILQHTIGRPTLGVAVEARAESIKLFAVGAPVDAV